MKASQIKPRPKYVFIRLDPEESRESKYGIITPANVEQERKSIGTILSIGSAVKEIKKGDKIIFGTFAGDAVEIGRVDYKFLHEDDILGIIK